MSFPCNYPNCQRSFPTHRGRTTHLVHHLKNQFISTAWQEQHDELEYYKSLEVVFDETKVIIQPLVIQEDEESTVDEESKQNIPVENTIITADQKLQIIKRLDNLMGEAERSFDYEYYTNEDGERVLRFIPLGRKRISRCVDYVQKHINMFWYLMDHGLLAFPKFRMRMLEWDNAKLCQQLRNYKGLAPAFGSADHNYDHENTKAKRFQRMGNY